MENYKTNTPKKLQGRDRLREMVRVRDKHKCKKCGKKWEPGTRRFDVHHKDPELENLKGRQYKNHNPKRLITLCHKCHLNLHSVRHKMSLVQRSLPKVTPTQTYIRQVAAIVLRKEGWTYKEIGKGLGVSTMRACLYNQ